MTHLKSLGRGHGTHLKLRGWTRQLAFLAVESLVLPCFLAWRKGAKPQLVERLNSWPGDLGSKHKASVRCLQAVGSVNEALDWAGEAGDALPWISELSPGQCIGWGPYGPCSLQLCAKWNSSMHYVIPSCASSLKLTLSHRTGNRGSGRQSGAEDMVPSVECLPISTKYEAQGFMPSTRDGGHVI